MLEQLEGTEFSSLIRSELWGWPLALTVHAFGTALVVGFIMIISLRLLGLFELIPYASLRRLFPVVWLALILQFGSGFVLWAAKPTRYVADGAFLLKAGLIVLAIILTIILQSAVKRQAAAWEVKGVVSMRTATFVAATLLVWCSIVVTGRLIGYLGAFDLGIG